MIKLFRSEKVLFESKDESGGIQVVERNGRLELRFGNHIIQSAHDPAAPDFLALDYNRAMMAGLVFVPGASSLLQVGLGAGSLTRFIHRHFPGARQHVVELSQTVIDVAHRYFDLPVDSRLIITQADAGEYIRGCQERFDLIFLDAYLADGVAGHLETLDFYQLLRGLLNPGGWLVNNVWGSDVVHLRQVWKSMTGLFAQVHQTSVRADSNVIFYCGLSTRPVSERQIMQRARLLEARAPMEFTSFAGRMHRIQPLASAVAPPEFK